MNCVFSCDNVGDGRPLAGLLFGFGFDGGGGLVFRHLGRRINGHRSYIGDQYADLARTAATISAVTRLTHMNERQDVEFRPAARTLMVFDMQNVSAKIKTKMASVGHFRQDFALTLMGGNTISHHHARHEQWRICNAIVIIQHAECVLKLSREGSRTRPFSATFHYSS